MAGNSEIVTVPSKRRHKREFKLLQFEHLEQVGAGGGRGLIAVLERRVEEAEIVERDAVLKLKVGDPRDRVDCVADELRVALLFQHVQQQLEKMRVEIVDLRLKVKVVVYEMDNLALDFEAITSARNAS